MTLLSTLLPIGGMHGYVEESIRSALAELPPDSELMLIADGIELPTELVTDPRIRVVHLPEKKGTAIALNEGIRASTGTYLARHDSDDRTSPDRLKELVARMEADPELVLIGCCANLIDDDGNSIGAYDVPTTDEELRATLLRRNPFVHSSIVMRRSALETAGLYDDACVRMQDYELFLRLARHGRLANHPQRLADYRVHSAMTSKTSSPFSPYARLILKRRRELARHDGASVVSQTVNDGVWMTAQVLRYYGLRRPGYLIRKSA